MADPTAPEPDASQFSAFQLHAAYSALLRQHLSSRDSAFAALSDIHAPVWQRIAHLLSQAPDASVQSLLTTVFSDFHKSFPTLPASATRRPSAKTLPRLRRKLNTVIDAQKERSACSDWIACRVQAPVHNFDRVKADFYRVLGDDVLIAWRSDTPAEPQSPPDVVTFGYAFRVGGNAVMEIQVVEPVAAWVFEMNSRAKHAGNTACVTFKESKVLFDSLKDAILRGLSKEDVPDAADVVAYYERVRGASPHLDYDELRRFQELVDDVFRR